MVWPPQDLGSRTLHDLCAQVRHYVRRRNESLRVERAQRLLVVDKQIELAACGSEANQLRLQRSLDEHRCMLGVVEQITDSHRRALEASYTRAIETTLAAANRQGVDAPATLRDLVCLQSIAFGLDVQAQDLLCRAGETLLQLPVGLPILFRDRFEVGSGWQGRMIALPPKLAVSGKLPMVAIDLHVRSVGGLRAQLPVLLPAADDPLEKLAGQGVYLGPQQIVIALREMHKEERGANEVNAVLAAAGFERKLLS